MFELLWLIPTFPFLGFAVLFPAGSHLPRPMQNGSPGRVPAKIRSINPICPLEADYEFRQPVGNYVGF